MKKIFYLLFAVLAFYLTACSDYSDQELYPYRENGKWGYIDKNGEVIITPQFEEADDFVGDYAAVLLDSTMLNSIFGEKLHQSLLCIIDKKGRIQTKGGLCYPFYGIREITTDGYVIGDQGTSVGDIPCVELIRIKDGERAFPLSLGRMHCDEIRFKEGMLAFHDIEKDAWGFVDIRDTIVIKPQYAYVLGFVDGIACVQDKESGKYYLIDKTGKRTTKQEYESMIWRLAPNLYTVNMGDGYGFINSKGEIIVEPKFDDIVGDFTAVDLLYVKMLENNELKYAYVNKAGEIVIGPYEELGWGESQDDIIVYGVRDSTGYKEGYLDMKGNVIISPRFSHACDFSEGLAWAQMAEGEKYGYIDRTGKYVIQPTFDSADMFQKCGMAIVKMGEKEGVIDKTGKYILAPEYTYVKIYDTGIILFHKGEKMGYANALGEIVYMEK